MIRPIVPVSWLATQVSSDEVAVVDTRWYLADPDQGRREYERSHVPGAHFLDLESDLTGEGPGRHPLPDRASFAAKVAGIGISDDDHVVVYDHGPGSIAARLWWMLRHVGHHRVSVLDGGMIAWEDAGYATTAEIPAVEPGSFTLRASGTTTIDRSQLFERLGSVQILDARAKARYRGDEEPVDPVGGHIPTAISAPTTDNLQPDGTFKTPEQLAHHFEQLGIHHGSPIVSSCGSGVTACHNILALHVAGFPEAALYPGSWSDWSTSSLPVATGDRPGTAPVHR